MALTDLPDWLDEQSRPPTAWFVKRLQANDTLAAGSHQAGPYLPKDFLFAVYPQLRNVESKNPRIEIDIYIDSQGDHRRVRAIWYNNRHHGGTRNETRITGFGGGRSDLLDPESTGAVAVLAFDMSDQPAPACHVWVCRDDTECDLVEAVVGRVDPGTPVVWATEDTTDPDRFRLRTSRTKTPAGNPDKKASDADEATDGEAPSIETLVRRSAVLQPLASQSVDIRLLRRHERFIELFRQSEQDVYAARARNGFSDIASLLETAERIRLDRQATGDDGVALQLRQLFEEEGLTEGAAFSFRPVVGSERTPDFVFPAIGSNYAAVNGGTLLLVEPAIRDRWKAAVEGIGAPVVHVLTLQRGASNAQFDEMTAAGIILVVPARLHDTYPTEVRSQLVTLESFIADVRHLQQPSFGGSSPQL